jgi:pantothenate kinase
MDIKAVADSVLAAAGTAERFMVAIAGPPGAGKSTVSAALHKEFEARGESSIVVPMDGFHFDDIVLNARGHRARKGAPHTFDVAGFEVLLRRIRAMEPEIAIPVFDRSLELSRAAADIVDGTSRIILVEGNYLLLDEQPWDRLRQLFDYTIFISVPEDELERRLLARIQSHGFDAAHARHWIDSNDLPNIRLVNSKSTRADLIL